jgi:hypothetical protein
MLSIGTIAKQEVVVSNGTPEQLGAMSTSELRRYAFALFSTILDKTSPAKEKKESWHNPSSELFLEELVMQVMSTRGIKKVEILHDSKYFSTNIFRVFESVAEVASILGKENIEERLTSGEKSKLVVGLFPFDEKPKKMISESSLSKSIQSAQLIDPDGMGVFLIPNYWQAFDKFKVREIFNSFGLEITALIRTPRDFLRMGAVSPIIVLVERKFNTKLFLLDARNFESIDISFENFFKNVDSGQIDTGIWENHESFEGFDTWEAKQKLLSLSEGYIQHYQEILLVDVAVEINLGRHNQEFEDKRNAIYIPLIGRGNSLHQLEDTSMKHQNYCQVVLDDKKVIPMFLCSYLNSPYGKTRLELMKSEKGGFIPKLNKEQLNHMKISLPTMEMQQRICDFLDKFSLLRETIRKVEENFALNPVETKTLLPTIEDALNVFNQLSAGDKIKSLVRAGESKVLEFKQTFVMDMKTGSKESYISDASLKTIAAFLNTDGGDLLIGVNDEGKIVGVDEEIEKLFSGSTDKYLLHFKNLLKAQIGEQFYPLVNYNLEKVDEQRILHVVCGRSDKEVFVSNKDFYIRTNPATDRLDGPKQIQYIRKRFG